MRRLGLFLCAAFAAFLAGHGSALAAQVRVSLTFDDGWASQATASSMLAAHGLKGTFYVNSGTIGQSGFLSWAQVTSMNAAGNEIAGHTLTHPDLTTLTSTQAQHEICDDRTAILSHGFVVPSFAYPFGAYDVNTGGGGLDVSSIPATCGYASARGAFGLHNITATSDTRSYATSIPPPNQYKIPTPCCINNASFGGSTPTAAALESYVQHAQSQASPNPGWVIFFFHRLCDDCGGDNPAPAMSPSELDSFLGWLESGPTGVDVRTVAQVIKNDLQAPASSIACGGAACSSGWYGGPVSVSLSAADTGTAGVAMIRYTTDGSEPTAASPLYTGPFTVPATTTVKYRAWDNANNLEATKSQLIRIDTTAPSSSIACGGSTCSSGWYGGTVSVSLAAVDTESGVGVIRYTTDGTDPTPSSPAYTTPFTVSATTTVKYRAWDNAGNVEATNTQLIRLDTTAPSSSIACGGSTCSSGWYGGTVSVSLAAVDTESGVGVIRYTTNGTDPTTSSPAYTAPFTVSSTTTVKYRAWDNAGNVEATNTQLIRIDTTAPSSSIACGGSACSSAGYVGAVTATLSANDSDSGVAVIRYTLDGTDPTAASTAYSDPITISQTTTVKYRAWDVAGNVEATNSQLITIITQPPDTDPPTSSIACNLDVCSAGWYGGTVSVSLSAADGGSGVGVIRYTTDGTDPTPSSPAYTTPFTVSATTTVKYRAWDNAGNVEATNTQLIRIDTTAPSSSIACGGSTCSSGWYGGAVSVSLTASDAESGVGVIRYTTNGTDPTTSSPAYTAPFTVSSTTTVKYRAWDNAGNVEATKSQLIRIDTASPTVAITSPANGATVNGNVRISATAADAGSGVAQVSFYADGALIGTARGSNYSVNWNTSKVPRGQHTLVAIAQDVAGNSQTSAAITVTVR